MTFLLSRGFGRYGKDPALLSPAGIRVLWLQALLLVVAAGHSLFYQMEALGGGLGLRCGAINCCD